MKKIEVKFDCLVDDDMTVSDIRGWLRFNLNEVCSMDKNPMSNKDIEATNVRFSFE